MTRLRFLFATVIVVALVVLAGLWDGTGGPAPATTGRPPLPAVRPDGDLGSTWYCAAGTAAVPTQHLLLLANPTKHPVAAHLTGFTAAGGLPPKDVEIPAGGPLVLNVAETLGDPTASVLVESPSPMLAVDHQLLAEHGADRDACVTSTSDSWAFPVLASTADAGVRLTLFNPFPGDAGVDVAIGLDTGTRVPSSLTGIVVPGGTSKVLDLGEAASRREQFTATVHSRSGRVVAEVAQNFDGSKGPRGLRMASGVTAPAKRWAFAGGFTGAGASEHLVVQNPGRSAVHALVQVTPYGASKDAPEPLQIDVEAGRHAVVDLSAESRIPGVGYHSIEVEADGPVVVGRATALSGPPDPVPDPAIVGRPPLTSGVALSTGTPVSAARWLVPSIDAGVDPNPVLLVHNPGDGIAVVTATALVAGTSTPIDRATRIEVAPGDSVAVPLGAPPSGAADVTVAVESSEPVVVERLTTFPDPGDLSFDMAVPVVDPGRPLRLIGRG